MKFLFLFIYIISSGLYNCSQEPSGISSTQHRQMLYDVCTQRSQLQQIEDINFIVSDIRETALKNQCYDHLNTFLVLRDIALGYIPEERLFNHPRIRTILFSSGLFLATGELNIPFIKLYKPERDI